VFLALPIIFACNNSSNDTVQKADSANEAKSDTSNSYNDTTKNNKMSNNGGTIAVDNSTADFMVKVADVGMTQVKLGKIAEEKSTNSRIKDYGQMMTRDHTKAGDELKSLARRKNVTLPDSIGNDHRNKVDNLEKKTGKDFDRAYIDMMVDGHQSTVNDFQKASRDTKDPGVKNWIDATLPTLQMHLDSAKAIQKAIKH
jgi:putative membrane protein